MNDDLIGRPGPPDPAASRPASPDPMAPSTPASPDPSTPTTPAPAEAASRLEPAAPPVVPSTDQPAEDEPEGRALDRQIRTIVEWVAVAVGALAVALIIKTFLLQAFYIPSGSMRTTLAEGDRVLVNKLSYDLHDVNRGDVIVFEKPPGEAGNIDDLIKRVIALPGETVVLHDGHVFIDDQLLEEPYLDPGVTSVGKVLIPNCDNPTPAVDTCTVPEGRVFVMGDNREASHDSRYFGPILDDSIVGRAFLKVWPLSDIGFL